MKDLKVAALASLVVVVALVWCGSSLLPNVSDPAAITPNGTCPVPSGQYAKREPVYTADRRYIIYSSYNQYGTSEVSILRASDCALMFHDGPGMSHMDGTNNGWIIAVAPRSARLVKMYREFVDLDGADPSKASDLEIEYVEGLHPVLAAAAWSADESYLSYVGCTQGSPYFDCSLYIALGDGTQAQKVLALPNLDFDNSIFEWTLDAEAQRLTVWAYQYRISMVDRELTIEDQSPPVTFADLPPANNRLIVWDAANRQVLRVLSEDMRGCMESLSFSPDGQTMMSVQWDYRSTIPLHIKVWDAETWDVLEHWKFETDTNGVVAVSLDGKMLALENEQRLEIWDLTSMQQVRTITSVQQPHRWVSAKHGVWSPDGKTLAVITDDQKLIVWDVIRGEKLIGFESPEAVQSLGFSPDGKTLAVAGWGIITLSDVPGGRVRHILDMEKWIPIRSLAFSPDGTMLASNDSDGIKLLWSTATGERLHQFNWERTNSSYQDLLAFSPDGAYLAETGLGGIAIWEVATKVEDFPLTGGHADQVSKLAYSPDGKLIVSSGCGR